MQMQTQRTGSGWVRIRGTGYHGDEAGSGGRSSLRRWGVLSSSRLAAPRYHPCSRVSRKISARCYDGRINGDRELGGKKQLRSRAVWCFESET
jgi:hypothetical protein